MTYAGCFLFKEKVQPPVTRIWKAGICEKVRSDFGSALLNKYYQFWKVSADMSKDWLGLISINVSKATPSRFFGKEYIKPVGLLGKCTFMKSSIGSQPERLLWHKNSGLATSSNLFYRSFKAAAKPQPRSCPGAIIRAIPGAQQNSSLSKKALLQGLNQLCTVKDRLV